MKVNAVKSMFCLLFFTWQITIGFTQQNSSNHHFHPGRLWYDEQGELINAHGGGILYSNGKYYWFGEKRGRRTSEGVNVYSSNDLYNWKLEALALAPNDTDTSSDIARGCLMERPKVIYNKKTHKYVMWFHLELRGKGYSAARAAVAVSDNVTGPYKLISSFRPNGNMSRDMTLFVDEDGSAYHVYSSRENYDLRIVKLTDDYLQPTTQDSLMFSKHREAPALFKYGRKYYLITSGCTGWAPNKASVHEADNVFGPWKQLDYNPMSGPGADSTFGAQSTYIQPVTGKENEFIFMADKWNPHDLRDSRHIWLPVHFHNGLPLVEWTDEWSINNNDGYSLVWSDEFEKDGAPDSTNWTYENGFVRNEEWQWYQPQNAHCSNGKLVIEARREQKPNPVYKEGSNNWRQKRPTIAYTSSCVLTAGRKSWLYGRFEMRGRINIQDGIWPAWWTLGIDKPWPANGEIDIMEYYRKRLLANIACAGKDRRAEWHSNTFSIDSLGAQTWAEQFHVWRMDWTPDHIALYVDDHLLNNVPVDTLVNKDGSGFNPFKQPHYMLLNLAIGGQNGGNPEKTSFPVRFEIDYVRVYQDKTSGNNVN